MPRYFVGRNASRSNMFDSTSTLEYALINEVETMEHHQIHNVIRKYPWVIYDLHCDVDTAVLLTMKGMIVVNDLDLGGTETHPDDRKMNFFGLLNRNYNESI